MRELLLPDVINGVGHDGQDYFYAVRRKKEVCLFRFSKEIFGRIKNKRDLFIGTWQEDDKSGGITLFSNDVRLSKNYLVTNSSITTMVGPPPSNRIIFLTERMHYYNWKGLVALLTDRLSSYEVSLLRVVCPYLPVKLYERSVLVFNIYSGKILLDLSRNFNVNFIWIAPDLMTAAIFSYDTRRRVFIFDLEE